MHMRMAKEIHSASCVALQLLIWQVVVACRWCAELEKGGGVGLTAWRVAAGTRASKPEAVNGASIAPECKR